MSQKYIGLNIWKGIYRRSVHKKVPFKYTLYFRKYKKDKFLTKRCTILLFTIRNLSFLYLPKYKIFFNGTFLHTLLLYIFIYVFNANFFEDIDMWDFEIFKILKVKRTLVSMGTKSLLHRDVHRYMAHGQTSTVQTPASHVRVERASPRRAAGVLFLVFSPTLICLVKGWLV
jgi:hypothetical protein